MNLRSQSHIQHNLITAYIDAFCISSQKISLFYWSMKNIQRGSYV